MSPTPLLSVQIKPRQVTWKDFDRAVTKLANELDGKVSCVTGLARGGLPLAVALSHRLNVPFFDIGLCMSKERQGTLLCVDDIYDSGRTIAEVRVYLPKNTIYAVWLVRRSQKKRVLAADIAENRDWIIFPWENPLNALKDKEKYDTRNDNE